MNIRFRVLTKVLINILKNLSMKRYECSEHLLALLSENKWKNNVKITKKKNLLDFYF